jgi:hypothetical protein
MMMCLGDDDYGTCDRNCQEVCGKDAALCSQVVYVMDSGDPNGDASFGDPVDDLMNGIMMIQNYYAVVMVMGDLSIKSPVYVSTGSVLYIEIRPLFCNNTITTNCVAVGEKAKISLGGFQSSLLVYSTLVLKDLILDQKFFFQNCATCDYCRATTDGGQGSMLDDRNQALSPNDYLSITFCQHFQNYELLMTQGSTSELNIQVI